MFRFIPLFTLFTLGACGPGNPKDKPTCDLAPQVKIAWVDPGTLLEVGQTYKPNFILVTDADVEGTNTTLWTRGPLQVEVSTDAGDFVVPPDGQSESFPFYSNQRSFIATCLAPGPATLEIEVEIIMPDCTETATDTIDVVCFSNTEPIPLDCDDEILLDQRTTITELLGIDGCDDTVTITDQSDPVAPDGQTTSQPVDHTGIVAWMAGVGDLDQTAVDSLFEGPNAIHPCVVEEDGGEVTVCSSYGYPFAPGPFHVFAFTVHEDIPLDDPTNHFQFGFYFDSDGDPSNNRASQPPYSHDFSDGTDLWYTAFYGANNYFPWYLSIRDWTTGVLSYRDWSSARIIVTGNTVVLAVESWEFDSPNPSARFAVRSHPGDYGYGGTWSADVEPPIADGLHDWTP